MSIKPPQGSPLYLVTAEFVAVKSETEMLKPRRFSFLFSYTVPCVHLLMGSHGSPYYHAQIFQAVILYDVRVLIYMMTSLLNIVFGTTPMKN